MRNKTKLEPAVSVIRYLGGAKKVADITGKSLTRVYRWTYPDAEGGTGGIVPAREQRKLLDHAQANGIDLRPADFFDASRLQAEAAA